MKDDKRVSLKELFTSENLAAGVWYALLMLPALTECASPSQCPFLLRLFFLIFISVIAFTFTKLLYSLGFFRTLFSHSETSGEEHD